MRSILGVLPVLIIGVIIVNCTGGKKQSDQLASGKAIYEQHCVPCHGAKGEGDGPAGALLDPRPRNYAKDGFKYGSNIEEVKRTIKEGIQFTAMPSFSDVLGDDQVTDVAIYVKALASQTAVQ